MTVPTIDSVTPTAFTTAAQAHAVAMPGTVAAGRLILIHFAYSQLNGTTTTPTDGGTWTVLQGLYGVSSSPNFIRGYIFTKIADGSEGGTTVNCQTSGNVRAVGTVYVINNWSGDLTYTIATGGGTSASTTSDPASRSWTWGTDDQLAITFSIAQSASSTVSTYPTGYTNTRTDVATSGCAVATCTKNLAATASPENPAAYTWNTSELHGQSTVVIRGLASPTGTIAATLQKATFSGSGAQTQTGTIAAILQKALFTGSGAQTQTGTIAATLQKATFSGSGAAGTGAEGTIASTMQAATFSGTGVMQPSGTMAATMQAATFSGTGTHEQTGTIAATMQSATFSGAAEQIMSGAMAGTLQKATFSGAGLQTQTGTVAATLQYPTFTGAGYMLPEGSIAATMQKATFTGAGQHIQTGTMAATLQSLIFSGSGTQTQTGTMAATLQVLTFIGIALMQWPDASGTISDARAYSATLSDAYANSGTLSDARNHGGTVDDDYAYGGILTDARGHGGSISDG